MRTHTLYTPTNGGVEAYVPPYGIIRKLREYDFSDLCQDSDTLKYCMQGGTIHTVAYHRLPTLTEQEQEWKA